MEKANSVLSQLKLYWPLRSLHLLRCRGFLVVARSIMECSSINDCAGPALIDSLGWGNQKSLMLGLHNQTWG